MIMRAEGSRHDTGRVRVYANRLPPLRLVRVHRFEHVVYFFFLAFFLAGLPGREPVCNDC
jgi:hypothetical protein